MYSNIIIFATLIAVLQVVICVRGRNEIKGPACNEFDPQGVKNLNFKELAGKWYLIRTTPTAEPTLDSKFDVVCGTNVAIKNERLVHNPNLCSTTLRTFTPIPHTDGSSYNLTLVEENKITEWRLLYLDSEFAAAWGCLSRDYNNVCTETGGRLYRRTADATISQADMSRMNAVIKKKTCKTISEAYPITLPVNNECRDWGLPTKTTCNN